MADPAPLDPNDGQQPDEGFNPAAPKLSRPEILQGLKDILSRIAGVDPETISPDALIIEDVGVDSLGFYEILIEADETMGIKIEEKDLLTFKTVSDIVNYIESKESEKYG